MPFVFGAEGLLEFLPKLAGPLAGLAVGWAWGRWRSYQSWKSKEFRGTVALSLNAIDIYEAPNEEGQTAALRLRTIFERELSSVFPSRAIFNKVKTAIESSQDVEQDPILRFEKEDAWFVLNSVLNKIAEQFSVGTLRADMGADVLKRRYLFCITYEHEKRMHQFKPRILMFDKEKFLAFPESGEVKLETHKHSVRVETLRHLKQAYQSTPHLFMELEITL